jgi:hypothetical protein
VSHKNYVKFKMISIKVYLMKGQFSQTCKDIQVSGSKLSASCKDENGRYNQTSIDLSPYIDNVDGTLKWQPKNFIITCKDTAVSNGNKLKAECKTRKQEFVPTAINLDDHIANINGHLRYE